MLTTPTTHDNPAAGLSVENDAAAVELLVWDSGDIEFTRQRAGKPVCEHIGMRSSAELQRVFDRFTGEARRLRLV